MSRKSGASWREQHEAELEQRRLAKAAERAARREANRVDWESGWEVDQASQMGVSLEQLHEIKEQRRTEMQGKPRFGYSPDHRITNPTPEQRTH